MTPVERHTIFFDFDSTLIGIESLDELVASGMKSCESREEALQKIHQITGEGMDGKLAFQDSLIKRLEYADLHKGMFEPFAEKLKNHVTEGLGEYIRALQNAGHKVCVLSGGFAEYIIPVARELDIPISQVFANHFTLDEAGNVVGFDVTNPLIQDNGKALLIQKLKESGTVSGKVIVVGDGMTDYATFAEKQADLFIGCGIHIERNPVREASEHYFTDIAKLKQFLNSYLMGA